MNFKCVDTLHGVNLGNPALTGCLVLGTLDQSIQGLRETIGLARLRLGNNPLLHVTMDKPATGHTADWDRQRSHCTIF